MKKVQNFEYPEELVPAFEKAKKLEWITIAYLASTTIAIRYGVSEFIHFKFFSLYYLLILSKYSIGSISI